ncbi:MAG: DUF1549 domain-containing protein, partial [Planctomycetota bacterium]|nr:DUF1549 domain-containing protein [Planctomycetota bacterium]
MFGLLLLSLGQDPGADFFEAKVRPLFAEHCVTCHGEEKQKAELRLDRYGSILKGGESGAAISPGDTDASLLLLAVSYEDEFLQMPPRNQLAADELDTLHEWVRMGAPGPATEGAGAIKLEDFNLEERLKHWAYQPVKAPETPSVPRSLSGSSWARQPLDSFIEHRLHEEGLEPSAEADRATWLRRVHYGVTGLP